MDGFSVLQFTWFAWFISQVTFRIADCHQLEKKKKRLAILYYVKANDLNYSDFYTICPVLGTCFIVDSSAIFLQMSK